MTYLQINFIQLEVPLKNYHREETKMLTTVL